ncbi:MAG: class I SAM-dependent methyltransferase [Ignavibacteriaceae bacterium]|jgi:hypothetical protein|nr:class I SAM-dependent methyltransferase [Ignavibacteriaceae bacterium]
MNPWLEIPLADYEAHMSMASIAQAQYISRVLAGIVQDVRPSSVAIIGCSGGNGFDQLPTDIVKRVVGVEINPHYIEIARERYMYHFNRLELICQDFQTSACSFKPVDLVFAALIFEYVDYITGLTSIKKFIKHGGFLSVILQLPNETISAVSPSPYSSLSKLNGFLKLVSPENFEACAVSVGLSVVTSKRSMLDSGKVFHEFLLQKTCSEVYTSVINF